MSATITGTLTSAGRVNTPPATLNAELIANATALAPGLTILPAGLIEDIASTDTGAAIIVDQAVTETLGGISPYSANPYILTELGQIYIGPGSAPASPTNTGVYVVFAGTVGFPIGYGFVVSDGTYQYVVQIAGVIESGGSSIPLLVLATQTGSWAVPANTVTTLVTSVPAGVSVTVTNPLAGTPGGASQTEGQYRSQVLQAGLATAQGMPNMLKTALQAVPGVIANQVSVRTPSSGQWEVIVGGTGDPYAIGNAIYTSLFDVSTLTGSVLGVVGITQANPGVVTTDLNHNYVTGQTVVIAGVDPTNYNGTFTATVISPTTFSIATNTSGYPAYVSGGVVTPNFRNTSVTISDYPDSYPIPYVIPPSQIVSMTVTWNTSSANYVSPATVAQLAQAPIAAYINTLPIGAPINEGVLATTFYNAIVSALAQNLVTTLVFSITINGVVTAPESGTQIVVGDPESFFSIAAASVVIQQG